MVDKIKTPRLDSHLEANLKQDQVIDRIQKGSIWEIYKVLEERGVARDEIVKFFRTQDRRLHQVISPAQMYSNSGEMKGLDDYCMSSGYSQPPSNPDAQLSKDEAKEMVGGLMKAMGGGKAIKLSKTAEPALVDEDAVEEEALSPGEEMAEDLLTEYDQFMNDVSFRIMEQQMVQQYKDKNAEAIRELNRLVALARAGRIDAESVLPALMKVKQARSGVLMAYMGKKIMWYNEQMNRINRNLFEGGSVDPLSPEYNLGKEEMRQIAMDLNQLTNDIQQVANDIQSGFQQFQSTIKSIGDTKREIVRKVASV